MACDEMDRTAVRKTKTSYCLAHVKMHHARYIIKQNDDWVVEILQMKKILLMKTHQRTSHRVVTVFSWCYSGNNFSQQTLILQTSLPQSNAVGQQLMQDK